MSEQCVSFEGKELDEKMKRNIKKNERKRNEDKSDTFFDLMWLN